MRIGWVWLRVNQPSALLANVLGVVHPVWKWKVCTFFAIPMFSVTGLTSTSEAMSKSPYVNLAMY